MTTNITGHIESWESQGPTVRYNGTNFSFVTTPVKNSGGSCRLNVTSGKAWIMPGSGPAGDDHASFYFRFNTLPSTAVRLFWWGQVSGFAMHVGLRLNPSTGKLCPFAFSAGSGDFDEQGSDGGPVIQTGVWYLIDCAFRGGTRTWKWRIAEGDADPEAQADFVWSASHNGGAIGLGIYGSGSGGNEGASGTYDLYIGAAGEWNDITTRVPTYPYGHHKCTTLLTTGEGTHVNAGNFADDAANSPPVNPHTRLDEEPRLTTNTDWVKQTVAGASDYIEYTMENLPADALDPVSIGGGDSYEIEGSGLQISERMIKWFMDGVERNIVGGSTIVAGGGTKNWDGRLGNGAYTPDPTVVGINAMTLRQGYATDVTPNVRIGDLWLEVMYAAAPPGPEAYWDIGLV